MLQWICADEERLSAALSFQCFARNPNKKNDPASDGLTSSLLHRFGVFNRVFELELALVNRQTVVTNLLLLGLENEIMAVISFIQGLGPPPGMEAEYFYLYLFSLFVALPLLYGFSLSGRPLGHPDRKLGSNHKAAEAERVEILERLYGSKVGDANVRGCPDDVRLPMSADHDASDVEKEPLCSPLLLNSTKEGSVATITLSSGTRWSSIVLKSMQEVSEAAACGELVDECVISNSERQMLQTKVELHDGICERLKNLVKLKQTSAPAPLFKERTSKRILQIDNWAILKPSGM